MPARLWPMPIADRAIFVVNAHRDHRALEARVGHSRHRQQQLAGQEGRLFRHMRDNEPRQRGGQALRRRPGRSYLAVSTDAKETIHDHPEGRPPARRSADNRDRRRAEADDQRRVSSRASASLCSRCPARSRRPARRGTCPPTSRRRASSKARASTRSPAFRSTTRSSCRPGTSATAPSDITMLADGNGEFAEAIGLDDGRQQVRHGQALAALFDDRRRRRRRAAQRRGSGRISRVERRDDARPAGHGVTGTVARRRFASPRR